ncbi:MBL fold metallo-hydrolase [Plantactinospora siamensis]|uniref:MBL fold metallo-hydrolase n=1 Tax=Plantactinospora siamensis TaxID=555372 RepID=A0ABV6P2R2_9ACTN
MTDQPHLQSTVTFLGTATTVLRLGPFTLLTDPNFLHRGQRAYLGYGMWSRRLTDPALRVEELPRLDAVLLSHLHGDHFDRVARHGLDRGLPILTTPQAGRRLRGWGFRGAVDMRTWQAKEAQRDGWTLRVTAVPGQHGPGIVDRLLPQVMGTVLDLERGGERALRVYITGDTLNRPMLAQIPRRFPDMDAMLIHLGGTRIAGLLLTMDDRQGAELVRLMRPRLTVPIHYDDYPVFRSPLRDFVSAMRELPYRVRPVERGRTASLLPD